LHYTIGLAYKEKGNFDRAEASLKKALEVDPDLVDAHKVLEELYRSKGMLGDADRETELYKSQSSPHH
ncbi:MAG: tetratricopeptide repeat protein, partial [Planctomycetota bacterium]|nr:tetratricopeptide repeat protein [Planctomycetota bacterium]